MRKSCPRQSPWNWGIWPSAPSDTLTRRYLLPYLKAFHSAYPAVELEIRNGTSQGVLDLLHAGRVDVAFASQQPDPGVFECRRCFETHLVFAAAPDYPCDFQKAYTLQELAAFPLILLDHKASSRRYLEQIFLKNSLELRPAFELGTHDLQIALARIGLGVAIVTEEFSRSALERGVLRKLKISQEIPAPQRGALHPAGRCAHGRGGEIYGTALACRGAVKPGCGSESSPSGIPMESPKGCFSYRAAGLPVPEKIPDFRQQELFPGRRRRCRRRRGFLFPVQAVYNFDERKEAPAR